MIRRIRATRINEVAIATLLVALAIPGDWIAEAAAQGQQSRVMSAEELDTAVVVGRTISNIHKRELSTVSPTSAQARADFPKFAVELRGGVASPKVDFTGYDQTWEPGPSGSLGVNLDARPSRYLGFDIGVDVVMHAFGADGTISTTGGDRGITDREFLFTLGPRVIFPSADDQLLFSFGGGYAYARYEEAAAAQANEVIHGFSGGSRGGHGVYLFGQFEYAPSAMSPVAVGFRFGTVQAKTTGTSVGQFPGNYETQDRWPSLVGTLAFRFGR